MTLRDYVTLWLDRNAIETELDWHCYEAITGCTRAEVFSIFDAARDDSLTRAELCRRLHLNEMDYA